MRVAVTGTPGTGKTTATEHLDTDLDIVHLNDVIESEGLYTEVDEARDSKVADLDAVRDYLEGREDVLVESHLSHLLEADRVVVLRCAPGELERRLVERGEPAEKARENAETAEPSRALARKARENAESEALDVILSEAVRDHGKSNVYEIDTTDRDPEAVADDIEAVLAGDRDPSAGEVDFTEYL
ncbi:MULTISPECIES: adenylate kinase family protein [Halobacterium]|uniref:adenylate kinase family protein n=1 Tax=Halobacterium TaxID=2239 RepID=UPI00073EF817|nr:adenylate kinase family protein [Halobacterium sp. CBA1132]MCG1003005.1 adenylate kinase family protein [Halobacterium noricense]